MLPPCRRPRPASWPCPIFMSLGLVNTAPNCRLNFSPMSTPGAKAALKHYYDCDAPFAPPNSPRQPVRPAPRSGQQVPCPQGEFQSPDNFVFEVVAAARQFLGNGSGRGQALNATYASHRIWGSGALLWSVSRVWTGFARGYSANLWPCLLQPLFFV